MLSEDCATADYEEHQNPFTLGDPVDLEVLELLLTDLNEGKPLSVDLAETELEQDQIIAGIKAVIARRRAQLALNLENL